MSYCNKVIFLILFAVIICSAGCDDSDGSGIVSSWVQAGPNNSYIARVITSRSVCPEIRIKGAGFEMEERQETSTDFPLLVCVFTLPPGTETATVKGRRLPVMVQNPKRLVVIGDTGCRIKDGDPTQACNDPLAWPFKKLAEEAARFNPDVVIHVGDYVYRESPCPDENSGCTGSPYGDNFDTWNADFFSPADSLLRSSVWVFTRGNHELCSRQGAGWFNFLDPNPPFPECEEFTPPYTVDLGVVNLSVLDSSASDDDSAPPDTVEVFTSQIDQLEASSGDNAWLITHIPMWAIGVSDGEIFKLDDILQEASNNELEGGINLVLSGHLHFFETLFFNTGRQPQFIVGNSGTSLDTAVTDLVGMEIADAMVIEGSQSISKFGYATMELLGDVWDVRIMGLDGEEITACEIDGPDIECFP